MPLCVEVDEHASAVTVTQTLGRGPPDVASASGAHAPSASSSTLAEAACEATAESSIRTERREFAFDGVFSETARQSDVFMKVGLPALRGCLQGINGTILAYGQTGSGKTYSLLHIDEAREYAGLLSWLVASLFVHIAHDAGSVYTVEASALQVYNEQIDDLMHPGHRQGGGQSLQVQNGGVVPGLTWLRCDRPEVLLDAFVLARANVIYAETKLNKVASRSHAIFQLSITRRSLHGDPDRYTQGRLSIVDLAGSERVKRSGVGGPQFRETTAINKSLLAFGNVVSALASKRAHVPFRDSKLTRILEGSVGGNCRTAILLCLSPTLDNSPETLSSLEFGSRAMRVEVDARVNTGSYRLDTRRLVADLCNGVRELVPPDLLGETEVLSLIFPGVPLPKQELPPGFKAELRRGLAELWASRLTDIVELSLRGTSGGLIADLCGPTEAIRELRQLPLKHLAVQGWRVGDVEVRAANPPPIAGSAQLCRVEEEREEWEARAPKELHTATIMATTGSSTVASPLPAPAPARAEEMPLAEPSPEPLPSHQASVEAFVPARRVWGVFCERATRLLDAKVWRQEVDGLGGSMAGVLAEPPARYTAEPVPLSRTLQPLPAAAPLHAATKDEAHWRARAEVAEANLQAMEDQLAHWRLRACIAEAALEVRQQLSPDGRFEAALPQAAPLRRMGSSASRSPPARASSFQSHGPAPWAARAPGDSAASAPPGPRRSQCSTALAPPPAIGTDGIHEQRPEEKSRADPAGQHPMQYGSTRTSFRSPGTSTSASGRGALVGAFQAEGADPRQSAAAVAVPASPQSTSRGRLRQPPSSRTMSRHSSAPEFVTYEQQEREAVAPRAAANSSASLMAAVAGQNAACELPLGRPGSPVGSGTPGGSGRICRMAQSVAA